MRSLRCCSKACDVAVAAVGPLLPGCSFRVLGGAVAMAVPLFPPTPADCPSLGRPVSEWPELHPAVSLLWMLSAGKDEAIGSEVEPGRSVLGVATLVSDMPPISGLLSHCRRLAQMAAAVDGCRVAGRWLKQRVCPLSCLFQSASFTTQRLPAPPNNTS